MRRERSSETVRHNVPTLCRITRYRWIRCRPLVLLAPMSLSCGGAGPPWTTSACAAAIPPAPRSASLAANAAPIARDGSPPAAALARNAAVAAASAWPAAPPARPGPPQFQAPPAYGLRLKAASWTNTKCSTEAPCTALLLCAALNGWNLAIVHGRAEISFHFVLGEVTPELCAMLQPPEVRRVTTWSAKAGPGMLSGSDVGCLFMISCRPASSELCRGAARPCVCPPAYARGHGAEVCRACRTVRLCTSRGRCAEAAGLRACRHARVMKARAPECSLIAASAAAAPAAVAVLRASTSAARRATVDAFTGSLAGDTSHGGSARGSPAAHICRRVGHRMRLHTGTGFPTPAGPTRYLFCANRQDSGTRNSMDYRRLTAQKLLRYSSASQAADAAAKAGPLASRSRRLGRVEQRQSQPEKRASGAPALRLGSPSRCLALWCEHAQHGY